MSIRTVIGWLSEEDRKRYVRSYTRAMLVVHGSPLVTSMEQAEEIILEDQALYREFRAKYEIAEDEAVEFSLYDGAIYEAH